MKIAKYFIPWALAGAVYVGWAAPVLAQEDYGQHPSPETYAHIFIPPDQGKLPGQPPPAQQPSEGGGGCSGLGCPPTEVAIAQQLLASGPSTTEIYGTFESPAHQFAVVGFVKEGWPLSIEYEAQPGTVTLLRVKLYHERKILIFPLPFFEVAFQTNVDALPAEQQFENPWHRTVRIDRITLSRDADIAAGPGLHVARYELRSYQLVDGRVGPRAPLRVFGITVGPDVVGSLSLFASKLPNSSLKIPTENNPPTNLNFKYVTDHRYDLLAQSIERYDDSQLAYEFASPLGTTYSAQGNHTFSATWRIKKSQRPGRYRASIKAWWTCSGNVAISHMSSCPNDPDWAVATSDDVQLNP